MLACFAKQSENSLPIFIVKESEFDAWSKNQPAFILHWLKSNDFEPKAGKHILIPGSQGQLARVMLCVGDEHSFWDIGGLALALPLGDYHLEGDDLDQKSLAIAWGLGAYQFSRYKSASREAARLVLDQDILAEVENIVAAIYQGRDWVNTPTEDMGPSEMAAEAAVLAKEYDAQFSQIVGEDLLKQNYPAIHAVGRACDDAPRLLDMVWGDKNHPKLTLVGKGVCFDTGGLDIKPSRGMILMKKDMGGAAHVFALARMIMHSRLPVRLRVLVPAVENSVSGNAYRPGDVIPTRAGKTVEIGNTDAEGRVVMADALAEAVTESPELLIDMSTLTGAARVALGTDVPAMFSDDRQLVDDLMQHAEQLQDPMWALPLYPAYKELIKSPIADICNCSSEPYGGAITAALFLQAFVPKEISWIHFDMMAWNNRSRPGRPKGGEMMTLRAMFAYLQQRFVG